MAPRLSGGRASQQTTSSPAYCRKLRPVISSCRAARSEASEGLSVLERSLHFGPRTSITTPLRSKGLGFGLSCSCTLKYASSRGRGNVVIPKGFPRSVGRVESRLLGFPCFPYSVISMACFGNAYPTITVAVRVRFREQEPLVRHADFHVSQLSRAGAGVLGLGSCFLGSAIFRITTPSSLPMSCRLPAGLLHEIG